MSDHMYSYQRGDSTHGDYKRLEDIAKMLRELLEILNVSIVPYNKLDKYQLQDNNTKANIPFI